MASALYNGAVHLGQSACGMIFGVSGPFKIKVSPGCLILAIREKGKDVLQCKFEDTSLPYTYSPLEYAVKTRDTESVRALLGFGAKIEEPTLSDGTALHFYVDNLMERIDPDFEMLNLLLDHASDINAEDVSGCTVLERALEHMKFYENIHWTLVSCLLARGVRIKSQCATIPRIRTTPFTVLKDACKDHSRPYINIVGVIRSIDQEQRLLTHLAHYLTLEKGYHPSSDSGLTLKKFKSYVPYLCTLCSKVAIGLARPEVDYCIEVYKKLRVYHESFQVLVKNERFKDCFDPKQLEPLVRVMTEETKRCVVIDGGICKTYLEQLEKWGLVES